MESVCVIIPVYNEAPVIKSTIEAVYKHFKTIVCVDDGSTDDSSRVVSETAAFLVEHPINMGQGAALQTGVEYALQFPEVKYFVTFDADGQHDINDAKKMLELLKRNKLDIVLGSRFLGEAIDMPFAKRFLLKLAIRFTNLLSRVKLTDTHNGLRVCNREFAEALDIKMSGMAHASEIIDIIGRGKWRYQESPVRIYYTDYSKAKGQSMFNSINIFTDILLNRVRK